mgnify:CR=1 FL=1
MAIQVNRQGLVLDVLRIDMKKILAFIFYIPILINLVVAQTVQDDYFQGFEKEISGYTLNYHSPLPNVNACLLVRANSEFQPIEWQTQIIPGDFNGEFASFIWMYGMDTDVEGYYFDIYINGEKFFQINSPDNNDIKEWSVEGKDGALLTFNVTLVDKYRDQMGFAILKIPRSIIVPGKAVNIKVIGEKVDSNRWYMTFKANIREKINIKQENVIAKDGGQLFHIARFDFTHLGQKTTGIVTVGNTVKEIELIPGHNSLSFKLPISEIPTEYKAHIQIGNKPLISKTFTLSPVKEWTVYFVQHTHTDIGYTRPQTEILPEHLRYIDYTLDYCDQTDNYPEDAKFRWTCEASWAVREYLKSRPQEQIDRLIKRINEGRIEVTGMFFNYSEIVDETGLAAQTKTIKQFNDSGIHVTTAMQNDVNGIGWCLADYFQGTGVKYLIMGQHGHRARIPFDKPTAFWWESPSGNKLLAYRSEHYMYGNTVGLTSGNIDIFRKGLGDYLINLEGKGYPYSHTALQFSGYITDNAPPSTIASDMVKEWNEQYLWPKLKIAVASDFMKYLETNYSDSLEIQRVAWPDWWTDGAGSAMNEAKTCRNTHADMIANTGLLSIAKLLGAKLPDDINEDITEVYDDLLFYDEHTYGAAESISDPLAENTIIQWNEKAAYAWEAVKKSRLLKEKAMGFIQPYIQKSEVPSIAIFNTLNWPRSGLVTIYIDYEILPKDKDFKIIDYQGNEIASQALESRSDGTYRGLWVEDIPAMGYRLFRIEVSDNNRVVNKNKEFNNVFENEFYKLVIDKEKGTISSLIDKNLNLELLDKNDSVEMGQFIYEQLENRQQMERFMYNKIDTVYVPLAGERKNLTDITVLKAEKGPVWNSLFLSGSMHGCADDRGVNLEIRLYNKEKRIELHYSMHKQAVTSPESVYVAFPFKLSGSKLVFEVQGGMVYPGVNQLEGTAMDWNTIQNFAAIRNDKAQIVFGSNDIPLVQFGDINTGRYYYKHQPTTSHIYSWVLNNYWTTNFRASQEGEMKWSYFITSSDDNTNSTATRIGWGNRIPFLTRVLPSGNETAKITNQSLLDFDVPNVLLISAIPAMDGDGVILHLRETDGKDAIIEINEMLNNSGSVSEVNVLEEKIKKINNKIVSKPYETKFVRVEK